MITVSTIYWIGVCDSVGCALTFLAIALAVASILAIIPMLDGCGYEEENRRKKKLATFFCCSCLIVTLTAALIPSTRLAAAMYLVPAVVNNENVKAIGDNSLEALRLLTEDWLRELAESKDGTPPSK